MYYFPPHLKYVAALAHDHWKGLGFNSQSRWKICVMLLSVHALRLISRAGKRVQWCPQ